MMTLKRVAIFTSFVVLFSAAIDASSFYDVVVKRVECKELIDNYVDASCAVNLKNHTTTYTQINITTHSDVVNMFIRIALYKRFNTVYRKFLVDITEDFCAHVKRGQPAPVLALTWSKLNKYSNLAEACPMKKGKLYYVRDYSLDESRFPPGLPTGEYRIDGEVTNSLDKKKFVRVEIFGVLRRKPMMDIIWN